MDKKHTYDAARTAIEGYLVSCGWISASSGQWLDPRTETAYSAIEAFIIESYFDLTTSRKQS